MSAPASTPQFAPPASPSLSLGVIGNCAFSALVDVRGRTDHQAIGRAALRAMFCGRWQ